MSGFELIRFLLEVGITAQMGLFAIYLFSSGERNPARLALATLVAIFATVSIINAVTGMGFMLWLRPVNLALELSIGPAIYLFVTQIQDQPAPLDRRSLGHLIPFCLGPVLLMVGQHALVDPIVITIHSGYMIAMGISVTHGRLHYETEPLFRIACLLTVFFLVFILLRITLSIQSASGADFRTSAAYLAILAAMLILSMLIIITALRNARVFSASKAFSKYAGSTATQGEIDLILERLHRLLVDEELFRDPALSLSDLASRIKAPSKHLSQAVNARRGMSVPALINRLRVEAVAAVLSDADNAHLTVTDIMHTAGFGSKSAFQREFRRHYGMSPSEYRIQSSHKE